MTSIRLKIEESWYASMDCKVQKSGPWVCFYGGHSTGYKLGNHPKNIEPCAHRARTVRAPCAHRATTPPGSSGCGHLQPPSPSQPGRSLLALPKAKRCDPPPLRRSNTPSTSVSQPRAAIWPAQSPFALTAGSPSLPDIMFAVGIEVGTSTLTGQIAVTLNIKAEAHKSVHSKDYGTILSKREGVQHYCSTGLPVYGIGRSFETFGWVPPVTVGWGETSGCATLWRCSMVHKSKNIVTGSENPQFRSVMCAPCVRCACCAQTHPNTAAFCFCTFFRLFLEPWSLLFQF